MKHNKQIKGLNSKIKEIRKWEGKNEEDIKTPSHPQINEVFSYPPDKTHKKFLSLHIMTHQGLRLVRN
jgi:hypothetical protein